MWLVFLDVDGVLNRERGGCIIDQDGMPSDYDLDLHLLARFAKLFAALQTHTTTRLVLSTTWRLQQRWRTRLCDALQAAGIDTETVIAGDTPKLAAGADPARSRCAEVEMSINEIGCDHWVAIDDLDLAGADPMLCSGHSVLTDSATGLTEQCATSVGRLLTGDVTWELGGAAVVSSALQEWFQDTYRRSLSTVSREMHQPHPDSKSCEEWKQHLKVASTQENSSDDSEEFALEPGALDEWE